LRSESSASFRPDIEGLRAIAVSVVVAFHCGVPGFPGGFVGVDVFFVLSGYVITTMLYRELQTTTTLDLLGFYARRVRRLLPASALMIVTTLTLVALLLAPQDLELTSRAARATAVYAGNIFFERHGADYFAADVRTNPLLHMWSLAVEEQFYLCWPLLMLVAWRVRKTPAVLAGVLIALTAASLAACGAITPHDRAIAFYSLPTRAWEFGAGALASLLPTPIPRAGRIVGPWLGWAGLAAIAASVAGLTESAVFPGWLASIPVVGTVAALVAGRERPGSGVGTVLRLRPLQRLGSLSYSWYLWHWPLLTLALALLPGLSSAARCAVALGALAVAAVTHAIVENPIRFRRRLVARPGASLALGGALTVVSLSCALGGLVLARSLAARPELAAPTAAAADVSGLPREKCVSVADSDGLKTCRYGKAGAASGIVLFGDSHALQWFDALERVAVDQGWSLTTYLKTHCPAADFLPPAVSSGCAAWRSAALSEILRQRPYLVVMASSTEYDPDDLAEWRAATRRTLARLSQTGLRVAVIRDTPRPPFDVPTCLARRARHPWLPGQTCGFAREAALASGVYQVERQSAVDLPGVTFIDLTEQLCGAPMCPVERGGMILYRDASHITGSFSAQLWRVLEPRVAAASAPQP
jgi:peptidoglycan/LPS O-acetylase OafA/YrhL